MKNPREFWKNVHENNYRKYLGLYPPKRVLAYHKIDPKSLVRKRVMDLGVGDGSMCAYLQAIDAEPVAIDIVEEAICNIECEKYLSNDIKECPPVDVAIGHLLFQHCEDDEMSRILEDIQLKPGGYISFQIADLTEDGDYYIRDRKQRTVVFRTESQASDIIEYAGRSIIKFDRCVAKPPVDWIFYRVS